MNQANYPSYPNYPENGEQQAYQSYPAYQGQPVQQGYPVYPNYPYYPAQGAAQAPAFAVRQKDQRKSGALRTLNTVGLLIVAQTALTFAVQLLVEIVCMAAGIDLYHDSLGLVMLSIGMSPVCTALPPLIYMLAGKRDWNFHLRFGRSSFFGCLLIVLAGLGVCMAANLPAALISEQLEEWGARELPDVLGQGGGWVNFAVEFLGVAVMVPVLEEFAFRGVILSGLRRFGTGFAIAASAVIFGMAHMQLSSVVFATIAGVAMGAAYVITGNLWVSVSIHALNNGIAVIESYYYLFMGRGEERQQLLSGATMLAICALGILALVLLMVLRKKLFPKREPMVPADGVLYAPLGAGESAVTMAKSIVLWAILAMVAAETAMLFIIF